MKRIQLKLDDRSDATTVAFLQGYNRQCNRVLAARDCLVLFGDVTVFHSERLGLTLKVQKGKEEFINKDGTVITVYKRGDYIDTTMVNIDHAFTKTNAQRVKRDFKR